MPYGVFYEINGLTVTAPDREKWTPIVVGDALSGSERRSPFWQLQWTKQAGNCSHLDWYDFDNTLLTSLTCRGADQLRTFTTYTVARCQSVTLQQNEAAAQQIVATFLVNVNSEV